MSDAANTGVSAGEQDLEQRRQRRALRDAALEPVLRDLAAVGHDLDSVWDLVETKARYPKAIPVLLRWLPEVSDPLARGFIIRALGKPWAKGAVDGLLYAFPGERDAEVRWLIADALEHLWRVAPTDALAKFVADPTWGEARVMLLRALGKKIGDEQAAAAVAAAVSDPELGGHALQWVVRHASPVPRAAVEEHLQDSRAWVRRDAREVLSMLDAPSG